MWTVTCDYVRGVLTYFVEHRITGERIGMFDCVELPRAKHWDGHTEADAETRLMSLKPEPHWIPVDLENNEPQLEEWVLVSSDGYVMQDCIVERGGKKIWYHGGNIQADDRYMPLPEPYKGVTE